MNLLSTSHPQSLGLASEPHTIIKSQGSHGTEIKQGMTPQEIAELVSQHLIEVVKKQFEDVRNNLEQRQTA